VTILSQPRSSPISQPRKLKKSALVKQLRYKAVEQKTLSSQ
jgi:hypothetical protein